MYASTCMPALHFYGARRMKRYKAVSGALSFSLSLSLSLSLASFHFSLLDHAVSRDARSRVPRESREISSRGPRWNFSASLVARESLLVFQRGDTCRRIRIKVAVGRTAARRAIPRIDRARCAGGMKPGAGRRGGGRERASESASFVFCVLIVGVYLGSIFDDPLIGSTTLATPLRP